MNFKSLKSKITAQFGIILALACGSILTSIIILRSIAGDVSKVEESSPQFAVALQLNSNMGNALYNLRGYLISKDDKDIQEAQRYFGLVQQNVKALSDMKLNDPVVDELVTVLAEYGPEVQRNDQMRMQLAGRHDVMEGYKKDFVVQIEKIRDALISGIGGANSQTYAERIKVCDDIIRMEDKNEIYKNDPEMLQQVVATIMVNVNKIKAFAPTMGQASNCNKMLEDLQMYGDASGDYYQLVNEFKQSTHKVEGLGDRTLGLAAKLTEEKSGAVMTTLAKVARGVSFGNHAMLVSISIVIVVCLILIRRMTKSTTAPIETAVGGIARMADGDLTHSIAVTSQDELGRMSQQLNSTIKKLKDVVIEITDGSDSIYESAMEMAHTSQMMSQGANEQASSAEEVSSSVEEMSTSIEQNSDNARATEQIAENALQSIRSGSEASIKSMEAMREIAEKISIVDEIAFQTNILALNAAVEAARAGEHGKGFAVVAAEVRKLAERSSIAASEIDKVSKEGLEISERSGEMLRNIIPDMEKTANLVREIAVASSEQASGITQINRAVQQLNEITQEYAASAEQLASTSQNLASQSEVLKKTVSYFKAR